MSPSSRKRFSAFDDFPVENPPAPEAAPAKLTSLGKVVKGAAVERIERLKPSQMLPDRFQPRRLLPGSVRAAFFAGQLDCYQAAARWLEMARAEQAYQAEIDRLLAMGGSFEEHGQIKPITGSWLQASDGTFIFQIETGERRFWAACLRKVTGQLPDEPLLRVEVVEKPTRQRQVLENRHAETPSAVAQACEVASLILAERGITPDPALSDEYDYFRSARSERMPPGLWDKLMPIMQLTRPRMVQLLNILQFSTPLLELADRHRLPERVLREVLVLPHEQWERMLRISIQNSLTSEEIGEMTGHTPPAKGLAPSSSPPALPDPVRTAANGLRRFTYALTALDEFSQAQAMDEIADTLMVRNEANDLLHLLDDLAIALQARITRQ